MIVVDGKWREFKRERAQERDLDICSKTFSSTKMTFRTSVSRPSKDRGGVENDAVSMWDKRGKLRRITERNVTTMRVMIAVISTFVTIFVVVVVVVVVVFMIVKFVNQTRDAVAHSVWEMTSSIAKSNTGKGTCKHHSLTGFIIIRIANGSHKELSCELKGLLTRCIAPGIGSLGHRTFSGVFGGGTLCERFGCKTLDCV